MANIFEATAQLLQQGGLGPLNTNRIAERAGYSVGTLYSYFPDKTALLLAMALREMKYQEDRAILALRQAQGGSPRDIVRILVRIALASFAGRHRVRRSLITVLGLEPSLHTELAAMTERVTDVLLHSVYGGDADSVVGIPEAKRFIIVASMMGAIRAASLHRPSLLSTQDFEDELVNLVVGCLNTPAHPATKTGDSYTLPVDALTSNGHR